MSNKFFITEEEKKRIIDMHINATQKNYLFEQVISGGTNDPYQYRKDGNLYFYATKKEGQNPNWKIHSRATAIEAICTKIFKQPAGCGMVSQTELSKGVDSGVKAKPKTYTTGVGPSTLGAECTKVTVVSSFAVNVNSNPTHLTTFMTKLKAELAANPKIKADYLAGKAVVKQMLLIGGASNRYGGKNIKPELDNGYNLQSFPDNVGYSTTTFQKNKDLAKARATNLSTALTAALPKANIKIATGMTPKVEGFVVDTGGKVDKSRNQQLYPNPGQVVIAQLDVCAAKQSGSPKPPVGLTKIPSTIDEFKQAGEWGYVMTGAYFCNKMNSRDEGPKEANVYDSCSRETLVNDEKLKSAQSHMSVFEIKYNMNVGGKPYVRPVVRWKIGWKGFSIVSVVQQQVDKTYDPNGIFPSKTISPDDELFKLALNSGKPNGDDFRFNKWIKPCYPGPCKVIK